MLGAVPFAVSQVEAQTTFQGAWIATAWEVNGQAVSTPQRGLLVFSKNHYSIMYVNAAQERARYTGGSMTDAEKLAAYDSFTANAGIYSVSGDTITTKAYMAKDPNYMGRWTGDCPTGPCPNEINLAFAIDGTTLKVTWPARNGIVGTFRRVE